MRNLTLTLMVAFGVIALTTSACTPKYPSCKKDENCHQGEFCVNNICQQCRATTDCPAGQECASGACRAATGYCQQPSDCAEGQLCKENRCSPCMESSECGESKVCLEGRCLVPECRTTSDCPAGLSCENFRCKITETTMASNGVCSLEKVFFDFDSSELSVEARNAVERNYECMKKLGNASVALEGHCDPRGTTEYNMALGERRSRLVKKVLQTLGADPSTLRVSSKGKEEATGTDEASWIKDRRVEFK